MTYLKSSLSAVLICLLLFPTGAVNYSPDNVVKVAVKVLKEGATRETREDFRREVEIMSAFEHENILRLIGVVIPHGNANVETRTVAQAHSAKNQ